MDEMYLHDVLIIQDQAVEALEMKLAEAEKRRKQAKSRLEKAARRAKTLREIEPHRHRYNIACQECEAWKRRLIIARGGGMMKSDLRLVKALHGHRR